MNDFDEPLWRDEVWERVEDFELDRLPKYHAHPRHEILRKNAKTGQDFWGCDKYPECNWSAQVEDWWEED